MSLEEVFQQLRHPVKGRKSPRAVVEDAIADSQKKLNSEKVFTLGECLPEGTKEKLLEIFKGRHT
jgi:hypothetical protein